MKTLRDLIESTLRYNVRRRYIPSIRVYNFQVSKFSQGGIVQKLYDRIKYSFSGKTPIVIRADAHSQFSSATYGVFFLVVDMEFEKGKLVNPIKMSETPIRVRCTCPDFYWRFAFYNYEQGCLYGLRPPPYSRKTHRPSLNPRRLPGMCKHLMNAIRMMKYSHLIS